MQQPSIMQVKTEECPDDLNQKTSAAISNKRKVLIKEEDDSSPKPTTTKGSKLLAKRKSSQRESQCQEVIGAQANKRVKLDAEGMIAGQQE